LRDAITDLRGPIDEVGQVEATHDRVVFIDEDVRNADPGVLLRQERAISFREVLIEIVAAIADQLVE